MEAVAVAGEGEAAVAVAAAEAGEAEAEEAEAEAGEAEAEAGEAEGEVAAGAVEDRAAVAGRRVPALLGGQAVQVVREAAADPADRAVRGLQDRRRGMSEAVMARRRAPVTASDTAQTTRLGTLTLWDQMAWATRRTTRRVIAEQALSRFRAPQVNA